MRNVTEANHRLIEAIVWPHLRGIQLQLFLFAYCTFRELVRDLERERVIRIFFRKPTQLDPNGQYRRKCV